MSTLPYLSSVNENQILSTLPEISETSLPPITNDTNEHSLSKINESIPDQLNNTENSDLNNDEITKENDDTFDDESNQDDLEKPKTILKFPRLMTNLDISQTEPIYSPDYNAQNQKNLNIDENIISTEDKDDDIYEKMDNNVKTACNNDKEQFFKLYDILNKIFEYLYPTLNEMRSIY